MNNSPYQRLTVGAAVAAIMAGVAMTSFAPVARAAEATDDLVEVVVTGSRIVRRDTEANSPLVTVDAAQLESRSGLNIESYLNQLPAYNPAATPTSEGTNSDVQISAINSVGIASVSLRGLGANRSLVLVDGRRAVPTNALMVVDINSIPSSMIRGAEIISGGASATYGADALAGVSNMQLRRDFPGLETDLQYGITEVGDNEELRASVIAGTKIGDDRGNIVFAAEYYDREAPSTRTASSTPMPMPIPRSAATSSASYSVPTATTQQCNAPNAAMPWVRPWAAPATGVVHASTAAALFNGLALQPGFFDLYPCGRQRTRPGRGAASRDFRYSRRQCLQQRALQYGQPRRPAQRSDGHPAAEVQRDRGLHFVAPDALFVHGFGQVRHHGQGALLLQRPLRAEPDAHLPGRHECQLRLGSNGAVQPATDSPVRPARSTANPAALLDCNMPPHWLPIVANPAAYAQYGVQSHRHRGRAASRAGLDGGAAEQPGSPDVLLDRCSGLHPDHEPQSAGHDECCTGWNMDRCLQRQPHCGWVLETFPLNSFGRRATEDTKQAWQIEAGVT